MIGCCRDQTNRDNTWYALYVPVWGLVDISAIQWDQVYYQNPIIVHQLPELGTEYWHGIISKWLKLTDFIYVDSSYSVSQPSYM